MTKGRHVCLLLIVYPVFEQTCLLDFEMRVSKAQLSRRAGAPIHVADTWTSYDKK